MSILIKPALNGEWIGYLSLENVNLYAFMGTLQFVMGKLKEKTDNGLL